MFLKIFVNKSTGQATKLISAQKHFSLDFCPGTVILEPYKHIWEVFINFSRLEILCTFVR